MAVSTRNHANVIPGQRCFLVNSYKLVLQLRRRRADAYAARCHRLEIVHHARDPVSLQLHPRLSSVSRDGWQVARRHGEYNEAIISLDSLADELYLSHLQEVVFGDAMPKEEDDDDDSDSEEDDQAPNSDGARPIRISEDGARPDGPTSSGGGWMSSGDQRGQYTAVASDASRG